MEGTYQFTKILKPSHVSARRLDFPSGFLRRLPFKEGQRRAKFVVRYRSDAHVRTFHCIRRNGRHPKPTISRGWSQLVRDKGLQAGDQLIFWADMDDNNLSSRYWIQVYRARPVKLFGATIGTNGLYPLP